MADIKILDKITINKISAGEVVERPASVVKELIENSIDSGADAITVEIKNGGIEFIRITDNGCGISKDNIEKAFLRYATSKLQTIEDLSVLTTMGFRGEALASIAAVSKVTLITKQEDELMGHKYSISGGVSEELEEIGAPNGTTIIVKNLFYNTPARRKFLKSEKAEGSHIADIIEHLALCRPDISFTFINNNITKINTSGNKDLKEVIYRIYGRETSKELVPASYSENGIVIEGYIGTPSINRPSRNYETYFINHRFIKNDFVSKGIEEGYKAYLMQHKFPFCVLNISMDTSLIDVNVHPAKMEVRFSDKELVFNAISNAIIKTLSQNEMIPECVIDENKNKDNTDTLKNSEKFEPFETGVKNVAFNNSIPKIKDDLIFDIDFENDEEDNDKSLTPSENDDNNYCLSFGEKGRNDNCLNDYEIENDDICLNTVDGIDNKENKTSINNFENSVYTINKDNQFSLFNNEKVLSESSRKEYTILGQVFDTYWIISFRDKIFFVDQHAAHEKVNYEKLIKRVQDNEIYTQELNPPILVTLTPKESIILDENIETFKKLGFEIEEYGGGEYALRGIPLDLYFNNPKDMFLDIMNQCENSVLSNTPDVITSKIATMACKASVKGGMSMSLEEMEVLLDELLQLENPYHCPHGRPTIFSMSKYELEKKFKRVVD